MTAWRQTVLWPLSRSPAACVIFARPRRLRERAIDAFDPIHHGPQAANR